MDIPETLLRRLDVPGPRYTSYPTADRFHEGFDAQAYARALAERARSARDGQAPPLSLYIHIPFCESVCYYCACNKIITKHHERGREYVDTLMREIDMHIAAIGAGQAVSQLHFGGGSPTFLSDAELEQLMDKIKRDFTLAPGAEVSIEVDPRTASPARLARLAAMGFNRISFGVQDFDADVQVAVHRIQSFDSVRELVEAARGLKFESINADLIYGLPKQSPQSFARTIAQVVQLRPDRIALYSYAHLPERFKPQRRIDAAELPAPEQRIRMLGDAIAGFIGHGYTYIGMDHFALPGDALAAAKRQGRLHRNFQGYSTQPDCDLIALGVSAIGRMGRTYSQNAKTLPEYYEAIQHDRFAIARGLELTSDDALRRAVIMSIMCQGRVDYDEIERKYPVRLRDHFKAEIESLQPMVEGGLVEISDEGIRVTATGWFFVRGVAMAFDEHLRSGQGRQRFSRII